MEKETKDLQEEVNDEIAEETIKKEEDSETSKRPIRNNKGNNIILVIILILVIACVGVGAYLLGNGKKDAKLDNKKESEVKNPELKSEFRLSGNGLEKFDLYFLQLENEEKNKVYSPLSIKYALEMLAEGADGETKEQLDAIIGDYVAKKYTNSKNMSFANAFFVKNSFRDSIKNDYVDLLKDKYSAEVVYDDFKNASLINKWIKDKTLGMIPSLVDDVSSNDFLLVNALAIDMEWVKKIQAEHEVYSVELLHAETKLDYTTAWGKTSTFSTIIVDSLDSADYSSIEFEGFAKKAKAAEIGATANKYDAVNSVGEDNIRDTITKEYTEWLATEEGKSCSQVLPDIYPQDVKKYVDGFVKDLDSNYKHMSNSTDFLFYTDDEVKVFAKDLKEYDGTTLQYVGIMPKNDKLVDFIKNTNSSKLSEYIKSLKELKLDSFEDGYLTYVTGYIPMFKMDYELNLISDLKKMGVTDVFDAKKADLSKMTSEKEYIDPAIHKANIEFSNDGIKASAATAVGGKGSTGCGFEHRYDIPSKTINLTFDKPYLYLVRDKNSGEVWFTGTVYEPIDYVSHPGY